MVNIRLKMIRVSEISAIETYTIRKEILRKGIPLSERIRGEFDESSFHIGFFMNTKLIGVCSFIEKKHECFQGIQYRLAGMAILEKHQRRGVGSSLIKNALIILKKRNVSIVWCNARVSALKFYDKLGFLIKGEQFDIPHIGGHFIMYKNL